MQMEKVNTHTTPEGPVEDDEVTEPTTPPEMSGLRAGDRGGQGPCFVPLGTQRDPTTHGLGKFLLAGVPDIPIHVDGLGPLREWTGRLTLGVTMRDGKPLTLVLEPVGRLLILRQEGPSGPGLHTAPLSWTPEEIEHRAKEHAWARGEGYEPGGHVR